MGNLKRPSLGDHARKKHNEEMARHDEEMARFDLPLTPHTGCFELTMAYKAPEFNTDFPFKIEAETKWIHRAFEHAQRLTLEEWAEAVRWAESQSNLDMMYEECNPPLSDGRVWERSNAPQTS